MRSRIKNSTKNDNIHGKLEYKNFRVNTGGAGGGLQLERYGTVHVQHAQRTIYGQLRKPAVEHIPTSVANLQRSIIKHEASQNGVCTP